MASEIQRAFHLFKDPACFFAFKTRKDKQLSPAYTQFIAALLTGDAEKAFQAVKAVDLDNLGTRFMAPAGDSMKITEQTKAS